MENVSASEVQTEVNAGENLLSEAAKFLESEGEVETSEPAEVPADKEAVQVAAEETEVESEEEPDGVEAKEDDDVKTDEPAEKPAKTGLSTAKRQKLKIQQLQQAKEQVEQQFHDKENQYVEELNKQASEARFWHEQVNKLLEKVEQAGVALDPVEAENEALRERLRRHEESQQMQQQRQIQEQQMQQRQYVDNLSTWIADSAQQAAAQFGVEPQKVIALAKMEHQSNGGDFNKVDWKEIASTLAGYQNLKNSQAGRQQLQANQQAPRPIKPGASSPQQFSATIDGAAAFLRSQGYTE